MLSVPTLLIVGAGASVELGFPAGPKLRDEVSDILRLEFHGTEFDGPDPEFASYLSDWCFRHTVDHHTLWQAASQVSRTLPLSSSVDTYLDSHFGNTIKSACVKMGVARIITQAENKSSLSCNSLKDANLFDFRPLVDTWYQRLWSILQVGVTVGMPQDAFRNLRIITFNYDRNIERFLQFAMAQFMGVRFDQALKEVELIEIVHVYGGLGELEDNPDTCRSYRSNGFMYDLQTAAGEIRTFTERAASGVIPIIEKRIREAHRIIFLGFSFGGSNMDLLKEAVGEAQLQRSVYGTTYQMSAESVEHTKVRLSNLFGSNHPISNLHSDTCVGLFDRYAGII